MLFEKSSGSATPEWCHFSPEVLLFLLTGVPRLVRIERAVRATSAHDQVVDTFERYPDGLHKPRRVEQVNNDADL
jgi:hypothetical protein